MLVYVYIQSGIQAFVDFCRIVWYATTCSKYDTKKYN